MEKKIKKEKTKRVLIISQVLSQSYMDVLCEAFGKETYIDVITGSKLIARNQKVRVFKSPEHKPVSLLSRIQCWFLHYCYINRFMKKNREHFNLIFATSNPPINSYIGLKLKNKYRCPFVYMNWDIYPQVIRNTLGNPIAKFICFLWSRWNNINYPHVDKIITLGGVMAESIREDSEKSQPLVIPLPVDTQLLKPMDKTLNQFAITNDLIDKFIILYSGKIGREHNIEIILQAAERLRGYNNLIFVFIGHGEKVKNIKEFVKKNKLNNILLFPLQSAEMFPFSIAVGDIGIVSLDRKTSKLSVPSKIYSMMACGEAIVGISSGKDDLSELITSNRIGEVVTGENPEMLAGVIEKLYYNTNLLNDYKNNSRKTVIQFGIDKIIERYKKLFEEVLDEKA